MLGVLKLDHPKSIFAAKACIRGDSGLIEHYSRVLSRDLLIVYHEHPHVLWLYVCICGKRMVAVLKADHHGELGANSLLGFDRNSAVHEFYDILRDRHAETSASVFAAAAAVFLRKGVEDLRYELLVDTYSRIPYDELHSGVISERAYALHVELDAARSIGKLYRIREHVDQYLLELHVVAYVVVANAA